MSSIPVATRRPIEDYFAECLKFGVAQDQPLSPNEVTVILLRIAEDSIDIFGSSAAAQHYLEITPIYEGMNAAQIAEHEGIGRILSRIDDLRFGSNG